MLDLCEMIIVPHVVACTMDFNLLWDRGQQTGVLKPTKKLSFSSNFSRFGRFSHFFFAG